MLNVGLSPKSDREEEEKLEKSHGAKAENNASSLKFLRAHPHGFFSLSIHSIVREHTKSGKQNYRQPFLECRERGRARESGENAFPLPLQLLFGARRSNISLFNACLTLGSSFRALWSRYQQIIRCERKRKISAQNTTKSETYTSCRVSLVPVITGEDGDLKGEWRAGFEADSQCESGEERPWWWKVRVGLESSVRGLRMSRRSTFLLPGQM